MWLSSSIMGWNNLERLLFWNQYCQFLWPCKDHQNLTLKVGLLQNLKPNRSSSKTFKHYRQCDGIEVFDLAQRAKKFREYKLKTWYYRTSGKYLPAFLNCLRKVSQDHFLKHQCELLLIMRYDISKSYFAQLSSQLVHLALKYVRTFSGH